MRINCVSTEVSPLVILNWHKFCYGVSFNFLKAKCESSGMTCSLLDIQFLFLMSDLLGCLIANLADILSDGTFLHRTIE